MEAVEKVKNVIEDLYVVSDLDLHPFLGQLNFYISQLKNEKKGQETLVLRELPFLTNFMDLSFRSLIENYIQRSIYLKTCRVSASFENYDLYKAEALMAQLPSILKIIALIKLRGDLFVTLDDQFLTISASLSRQNGINEHKSDILAQIKSIFALKTLTTFQIRESEKTDSAILELKFDLSFDDKKVYRLDTHDLIGVDLCLPNQLKNYEISFDKLRSLNKHLIYKINTDCTVERVKNLENLTGQVIHFHFLFRPISFIIPKRGDLKDIKDLSRKDTGSDWTKNTIPTYFIDIFSSQSI